MAAIRDAAQGNEAVTPADRIAFAMKNTWQDRAKAALEHLHACGLLAESCPSGQVVEAAR